MKHAANILRVCGLLLLFFLACAGLMGMVVAPVTVGELGVLKGLLIFGGSLITAASSGYVLGLLIT